MNRFQRIILLAGLLAITGFCLRPPFQIEQVTYLINIENDVPHRAGMNIENVGHRWLWNPPEGSTRPGYMSRPTLESRVARIDWQRLSIYTGLMAAFCLFLAFVIFKDASRQSKPSTPEE
jgi:hypothetical protein